MKGEPKLKGLKRLREEAGLTQEQLAELLGVSGRQVCRWETRWSQPREGIETKLCRILGCSMSQLLGFSQAEAA